MPKVVRVTAELATANAHGPVKAGVVVVRGQVLEVRYDLLEGK